MAGCPARQLPAPGPAVTQARGRVQAGGGERGGRPCTERAGRARADPHPGEGAGARAALALTASETKAADAQKTEETQATAPSRVARVLRELHGADRHPVPCRTLWPGGDLPPTACLEAEGTRGALRESKLWRNPFPLEAESPVCSSYPPCPSYSSK